jgi:hypothetical protein
MPLLIPATDARKHNQMPAKIISIFGATGNQGRSVIRAILLHTQLSQEWTVRGVTRNPNKPDAQAMIAQGIQMVRVSITFYTWSITTRGADIAVLQPRLTSITKTRYAMRLEGRTLCLVSRTTGRKAAWSTR